MRYFALLDCCKDIEYNIEEKCLPIEDQMVCKTNRKSIYICIQNFSSQGTPDGFGLTIDSTKGDCNE